MRQTISRPPVYNIILAQLALTILCALLFLIVGKDAAISALIGGLISTIPNAYFIHKAFSHMGARQVDLVLAALYQGGTWKMVLTAIGFAAAFKLIHPLDYIALFSVYIAVQAMNVFASKIANL